MIERKKYTEYTDMLNKLIKEGHLKESNVLQILLNYIPEKLVRSFLIDEYYELLDDIGVFDEDKELKEKEK